ncbi:MAG: hypothetical protein H0X46_10530, partial [Bacteroidetes bacterium]|nr:hypothetical protein [Bacteroidota bacterium]
IPNFLTVAVCTICVIYGLSIDWSPYSLAMATYALINASMLVFIVFMSQQRFLDNLSQRVRSVSILSYSSEKLNSIIFSLGNLVYGLLRRGPIALLVCTALLFLSYNNVKNEDHSSGGIKQKEIGGFFAGINIEGPSKGSKMKGLNASLGNTLEVAGFKQQWGVSLNEGGLNDLKGMEVIPLINWELLGNDDELSSIISGKYDDYLTSAAAELRQYQNPVFVNFSPGFDQARNSGNTRSAAEFVKAWQYLFTFFNDLGISNVTWVWSPGSASASDYYPGSEFVDWIGVSCLNYGESQSDNDNYSFSELYTPFRNKLGEFQKPFMITEIGALKTTYQASWFKSAFTEIEEKYHEIHSVVLFSDRKVFAQDGKKYTMDFSINDRKPIHEAFSNGVFKDDIFLKTGNQQRTQNAYHSAFVTGKPGDFTLMINGSPYYIKGVAYNTAHDWRDGNMPLTRRQVEKDMQKIKEMGANTIRRYDDGIYDQNVLNIADEYDLNVLYGFWFDPEVDYFKDSMKVEEYILNVEDKVREFKDYPSVIAWSVGNETWGLLKHNYSKPYLTVVRQSYVRMIETLAQRIHEIDPSRPIFSCLEHEDSQLPGELVAFHDAAPSLDILGINSYYREQISGLNHVFNQFDSLRPYIISEFGPRGYWDPVYNRTYNKLLIEDTELEKGQWYK